ncbi:Multicopper oxidase type 1 [Macrophomina phaseolina MS6]|uniref:laccase n=2 Tax=Macrophomina phaseolina TaxID=35725 RepID=K2SLE2_MACPH|nr:Multicopper oxidase type 1 [Macrophomina phaseolina MS6]KAH7031823.1 Cupredoxin [Macrophomina phaseolina]
MRASYLSAAAFLGLSAAAPQAASTSSSSASANASSTSSAATSTCTGNTADDRTVWCDYDISTDYYNDGPDTGVTREYYFVVSDVTVSPDGISRSAMAVNGSIPGPTIFADWGDTVKVTVYNDLTTSGNGSSIHWHGIRQNYTNQNDGVVSITQCPIAVGETYTYEWKATQYGSSWYHSHIGLQAWEGVFGGIIINGPATANYDEDLGIMFLNDWDHSTVDELYDSAQSSGPPTLDTGLINGTNIYNDSGTVTGSRWEASLTEGTSYRLRLVNAAVDSHFKFSIDNHTLQVIAMDLVPIEPYETTVLDIGMGQRYDVIVTADQASVASDFWLRAIPQTACSDNDNADDIKGIIHYGSSTGTPETTAYDYTDACVDEDSSDLVPYVSKTATSGTSLAEAVSVGYNSDNLFRWYMNETSMEVEWENPTLLQVYNDNLTFTDTSGVVQLDTADQWYFFVIETDNAVPHPIHLHGHDFFVLAAGTGSYSSDVTLTLDNPPRRDTAMLDSSGYLVLAFETDNPGAWLMHCHIGWHTSEGFALQILERYTEIQDSLIDYDVLNDTCSTWSTYSEANSIEEEDSGV